MSTYNTCPPGYNCQSYSTCPSKTLPCPDGFFCSSYEGNSHESELDFQYAFMVNLFSKVTITNDNKEQYVDKNRTIQTKCLAGFYCPNATTILPCPAGHWCPPNTVEPQKCDVLSICPEQSGYQINFMNVVIMFILIVFAFTTSTVLRYKQITADETSRKKEPNLRTVLQASDPNQVNEQEVSEFKNGYIEIKFEDIFLQYSPESRVILPYIQGTIPAGQISAILGPTSSGKSSLLNILRLGETNGISSKGDVRVRVRNLSSNRKWSLDKSLLKNFVGHVPQEDIFDRELTVRELLTFNALTRIQAKKTTAEIKVIVDEVLSELSIQHVADSIIGGGENQAANISGGQLKRVNIGCELVSVQRPGMLLLDEPTNGLDASVAYELMETLETVRDRGITIVLVIQQPRAEIFSKIQHLFLMNSAGGIVYEGSSGGAKPYLQSIGYNASEETSDADFCVDVLNGLNDTYTEDSREKILDANQLHTLWKTQNGSSKDLIRKTNDELEGGDIAVIDGINSTKYDIPDESNSSKIINTIQRLVYLTYLNAARLLRVRFRNRGSLLLYMVIEVIMAIALSSGFSIVLNSTYLGVFDPPSGAPFHPYYPQALGVLDKRAVSDVGMTQLLFFISSALGTASCLASVPVFSGQTSTLGREKAGGMSVIAFGVGRVLGDLVFVILNAFVFAGIWCCFGHAGTFYNWMAVILCTAFAASGIGYISGAAIPKNSSNVFAIIICFICCVFAGVEPTLKQVNQYPVVNWPWYLSFATWTAEATLYTWTKYSDDYGKIDISIQDAADGYGYNISHGLNRSVGALLALGIGMRMIAIYFLWRKTK